MSERAIPPKPILVRDLATRRPIVPDQVAVECRCGNKITCAGTGLITPVECSCGRKLPPCMTVEKYNAEVVRRMRGKKCQPG